MTEETTTEPATEPATEPTEQQPSNREMKYRRELRETQTERDALREQVENLNRAEAERLAGLEKPAALWASGVSLDDLLDEDGQLDPAKIAEAAESAKETLGAAPARRTPKPDMSQGARGSEPKPADPFVAAFEPKR